MQSVGKIAPVILRMEKTTMLSLRKLQYLIERATDRVFFHFDMGLEGVF